MVSESPLRRLVDTERGLDAPRDEGIPFIHLDRRIPAHCALVCIRDRDPLASSPLVAPPKREVERTALSLFTLDSDTTSSMGDSKFVEALTYDEVQKHDNAESLWCIVKVRPASLRSPMAA